jgi:hypothetical protein
MNTTVSIRRWNPTVGSYVLSQLQIRGKAGERTGVKRFQHRVINTSKEIGWECRITATTEGFELISTLIAEVLAMPEIGLTTAAPVWVADLATR